MILDLFQRTKQERQNRIENARLRFKVSAVRFAAFCIVRGTFDLNRYRTRENALRMQNRAIQAGYIRNRMQIDRKTGIECPVFIRFVALYSALHDPQRFVFAVIGDKQTAPIQTAPHRSDRTPPLRQKKSRSSLCRCGKALSAPFEF